MQGYSEHCSFKDLKIHYLFVTIAINKNMRKESLPIQSPAQSPLCVHPPLFTQDARPGPYLNRKTTDRVG